MIEAGEQPCQEGPELLVDSKLHVHQPRTLATKIARSILVCMNKNAASRSREVIIPLYSSFSRLHPVLVPPGTRKILMNWSSAEATKVVGAGGQALWGEGEGVGLAQPAEGEALGVPNSSLPVLTRRSSRKWSQTCHSDMWQRMRDNRHMKQKVQTGYKQNLLPHRDNHTWEQVAKRGCVISVLGGF